MKQGARGGIIKVGKEVQKVSPTERKWVESTALVRSETLAMTEENHGVSLRTLERRRSLASCKFKLSIRYSSGFAIRTVFNCDLRCCLDHIHSSIRIRGVLYLIR